MLYFREEQLIKAIGSAYLVTGEMKIEADEMEIDLAQNKLIATGEVKIKEGDGQYNAESLEHDLEAKQGILVEGEGIVIASNIEEPIYLESPEVNYNPEEIETRDTYFTTCDREKSHYYFKANNLVIYPGDRIIAKHVVFWEMSGKLPLFYLPIVVYSLRDHEPGFYPQAGYSRQRGWFIKTTYNYYLGSDYENWPASALEGDFGQLYLDYFSKMGFAGGFKHYYRSHEDEQAYLYLYLEDDKREQDYGPWVSTELDRKIKLDNGERNFNLAYQNHYFNYLTNPQHGTWFDLDFDQSLEFDNWANQVTIGYRQDQSYQHRFDLGLSFDKLRDNFYDDRLAIGLDYGYTEREEILNSYGLEADYRTYFTNDLYLDYELDLDYETAMQHEYGEYDTAIGLTEKQRAYDWSIEADIQGDTKEVKSYYLPKFELELAPARLLGVDYLTNLEVGLGGSNRYQLNWKDTKKHGYFEGSYQDNLNLTSAHRLNYQQSIRQDIYDQDYAHWSYDSDLNLFSDLGENWTNRLSYRYQTVQGMAPDSFSTVNDRHKLDERLLWRQGRSRFQVTTGYDFLTERYDDLEQSLNYQFSKEYQLENILSYDLNKGKFKQFATTFKMEKDNLDYQTGLRLDLNDLEMIRWDNSLDWTTGQWNIKLNSSYDQPNGRFITANLAVEKDLHCRKLTLSYDHLDQEVWLQYQITAFPEQELKFGSSEGEGMLFDTDLGGLLDETD
ncbi:LptA/OstA family protein [Natroniella sp. ANB-PHB2]|uniref:LptA/OstA family protein n=1 Tax=Natroniella sp. ANB-PHB2 TaxID=3384444 RepID=UPI0038D45D29